MFSKGLKDVVAVHTHIASVDGDIGELRYRGVLIQDLAPNHSFEALAYFLWYGEMPNEAQLNTLKEKLINGRKLPVHILQLLDTLPAEISIMDALRTTVSAYAHTEFLNEPFEEQAVVLAGAMPVIIARHFRKRQGLPAVDADETLSHVENYLWMLFGNKPTTAQVEALETYMKLTMEHGLNAAAFAARVTISTESDLTAAVTSAIGTMKGPLHGGAPSAVIELLEEIGTADNIKTVIEKKLHNKEKIMGFGHRVYKTEDPRSILLREKCLSMSGQDEWLDLATVAEKKITDLLDQHKPGRKLYTNVEYYAAAIMRSIDLPLELFTPSFSAARIVGWTAHAIEQINDNTMFRPASVYIGENK